MSIERTFEFHLSTEDAARWFADADDHLQARFFQLVAAYMAANCAKQKQGYPDMQWSYIGARLAEQETEVGREMVYAIADHTRNYVRHPAPRVQYVTPPDDRCTGL